MEFFIDRFPLYLEGLRITVVLTFGGVALAFVLAMVFGIIGTMRSRIARAVSTIYVETFRGVSALVLMFWLVFSLRNFVPFEFADAMHAAIVALGLNVGAYGAEVVRAAINAVPKAQVEATIALNMTWFQRMRRVVIPQAWAQMLPTFGNLVIELMKASAVAFLIGVQDLTAVAQQLREATGETVLAFGWALVMYYIFAHVLIFGVRILERRASRKLGREPESRGLLAMLSSAKVPTSTGGGM